MPILERVDWGLTDGLVQREQRSRQTHAPGISMYRWWARRPHSLVAALLEAASTDATTVVSDPFSGGGTVAMEAARRGAGVYAQDLHPWATSGLASTLDGVDAAALSDEGERWLASLDGLRRDLYGSTCPDHGPAEILNALWVRRQPCAACAADIYLFPYSLTTLLSRGQHERLAWWGCRSCGTMTCAPRDGDRHECSGCGRRLEEANDPLIRAGSLACPRNGCAHVQRAFSGTPRWTMALVQRLCADRSPARVHIAVPTDHERAAAQVGPVRAVPPTLRAPIPCGIETARLRQAGFDTWEDLYPPRQLQALLSASAAIPTLQRNTALRDRLRLIVSGAGEMAGFVSRWDRYYPKAFEAMANHRFSVTGLAVEVNPLAQRGRGTLPRRLKHSVSAASWAADLDGRSSSPVSAHGARRQAPTAGRVLIARGSSEHQVLPDGSVDLVLTDPPYFDDVQYAELASLFLAWSQAVGLIPARVRLDLASEAVVNNARSSGVGHYQHLLERIMAETARTLRADGAMLITFHNSDGRAWWALGRALTRAGFWIAALAVAHAENETDHAKRNRRSFSRDLVLECRLGDPRLVHCATDAVNEESAELLAAGMAMASQRTRCETQQSFESALRHHLGKEPERIRLSSTASEKVQR